MILRPVTLKDAQFLYNVRNDVLTRQQSVNRVPMEWVAHQVWLENNLDAPGVKTMIAEIDDEPIGYVRARMLSINNDAEVSYAIAPKYRGNGHGKVMVRQFIQEHLQGCIVHAMIKEGNIASEEIARFAGLVPLTKHASEDPSDPRPIVEWKSPK